MLKNNTNTPLHSIAAPTASMEQDKSIHPLQITSCLMATVVIHAYALRQAVFHHLFLLLTVTSILFHSTHHHVVAIIDKITAHAAFLFILLDLYTAHQTGKVWIVVFPVIVTILWFGQSIYTIDDPRRSYMHTVLHLVAIAGLHVWLYELYGLGKFRNVDLKTEG